MSSTTEGFDFFEGVVVSSGATLYERPQGTAGPGWIAFVAFATNQPKGLSFADAWSKYPGNPGPVGARHNGGSFVVASERPTDPRMYLDKLVTAVNDLNDRARGLTYRYLFFGDPTAKSHAALPGVLPFATPTPKPEQPGFVTGPLTGTAIATRNVGVVVANSAYIYGDVNLARLRLAPNGNARIVLQDNKYDPFNIFTLDTGVSVPLDGAVAGTIRFDVTLRVTDNLAQDDFTRLDVGLKYFTERSGRILSQRYPVFGPPVEGSDVHFDVSYDPLRPLDHERTAFTFQGGDGGCVAMESALRDHFVHPVRLVPQAGVSRLVLQQDRVTTISPPPEQQRDCYYLVPAGPFRLETGASQSPATRVMCGMSPLETIVFNPPGSVLRFHPGAHAFSPLLADPASATDAPRLTDRYQTAWATVTVEATDPAGPAPTYLAQPAGGALFGHGEATDVPYLEHRETPAAVLHDASKAGAFPLAPYGAITWGAHPDTFGSDDVARLERDVLAVERRTRITDRGGKPSQAVAGAAAPSRVVTPQGFVVDLATDGSGDWQRLHLGQTSWSPDPARTRPTTVVLAFDNVDDTLRAAFQTNQQFLVITAPKVPWTLAGTGGAAATTTFSGELRPQGWPFHVRVATGSNPGDYRNVLIFKFCDGSIDARLDDHARWTAAGQFNNDPADVAGWLRSYVEQARQLAKGPDGAYFARFVEAVSSPSWRGVLALRVDADASALPQELRGLAAGVDLSAFNAHHLGIDLSFVDTADGKLAAEGNSSLFATVYYVDALYAAGLLAGADPNLPVPVAGEADYAFRVLSIKALFANAEIAAFASKSQVTLNRLFGDLISALTLGGFPAPSNSLVLDGAYENHDGVGVYVFGTDVNARFLPVSNLWRGVETVRATFSTLQAPASGTVLSRFSFRGFLNFATLTTDEGTTRAPFDLLSFGGDGDGPDPPDTGLPFSDLHLDMTYNTASPGTPSFAFLIDQMTLAPTVAQARPASLYARMPLTLTGIVSGTAAPRDLGYLPVNPLSLPTDPLTGSWHALVYTLDLGTAGALAARAGFTARLLVAWAPQSQGNGYRLALGLALPGSSGTSGGFSLQGVLKLTVDRILLYRDPATSTFVLRLTNVALSLLGVALPPGTSTAFIVFGNPDPGQRDVVGWYATVNREKKTLNTLTSGDH